MGMSKSESGKLGAITTKKIYEEIREKKVNEYDLNPVICKQCNKPHSYKTRNNKFCSISCATTYNNLLKGKTYSNCLSCGKPIWKYKKYCNNICQQNFGISERMKKGTASARTLKRFLLNEFGNKCSVCGITEWNNKSIVMELEHIDGNSDNNSLDNLSLICPNCHSQTSTYKGKNKGNGRHYRKVRYQEGKSY